MGNKEIRAARTEIIRSLELIDNALKEIESARRWGLGDTFGGGLFSGMALQGKIKTVNKKTEGVSKQLAVTEGKLELIKDLPDISIKEVLMENPLSKKIDKNMPEGELTDTLDEIYRSLKMMEFHMTRLLSRVKF